MSDTLNKINETKRTEISALKQQFSQAELEARAKLADAPGGLFLPCSARLKPDTG